MEDEHNVFTIASSPISKGKISSISGISKRLFDDGEDVISHNYQRNQEIYDIQDHHMTDQDECEGIEEFEMNERKPLEQLLLKKGKNEFIFDPENGGGRRRRIKKVSRLELLGYSDENEDPNLVNVQQNHSEPSHNN